MQHFRFPWLLSNVMDAGTGEPLAGAHRWHMLEWQGVRIGLLGAWASSCSRQHPEGGVCLVSERQGWAPGRGRLDET